MHYFALIGSVALIHLLAVMSPGPDFIMCVRNALMYSRKTGIMTAVGFGAGVCVHLLYCMAGLALVISQSILLFNTFKLLGAACLIYIGLKSFFSKKSVVEIKDQEKKQDIHWFSALKIGFITNVFNPKATIYFLSLFTLVLSPSTPAPVMSLISIIMITETIMWFSIVAIFFTQKRIRSVFEKFQGVFNKTLGGLLVLLGVKVALTEK